MSSILNLVVTKKYFELLQSGKKNFEYRLATKYWKSRLLNRKYNIVRFRNGYKKNSPVLNREFKRCERTRCIYPITNKMEDVYMIALGKIL